MKAVDSAKREILVCDGKERKNCRASLSSAFGVATMTC